ncbi:MAG TPA: DUF1634 domain-containing protein [Candidatus Limnocylindrales bacterium]|nr:DUF1634 domain-containing protein [Candidatus Limnocylindrales bacterium]
MNGRAPSPVDLDRAIARLLIVGTYVSVALLAIGALLMFALRISPLEGSPPFELGLIVDDIVALRPVGFIWLGLLVVVATPAARVAASLVGYLRGGEPRMALVSGLILVVIAVSVAIARGLEP